MTRSSLAGVRGLLVDLDGVVYAGREPIPGAGWFLATARRHALPFQLVTNNSTSGPTQVAQRLHGMGIDVAPDEILTSALATAAFVRARGRPGEKVLVVGEEGLREAVTDAGLQVADADPAGWVVVGLDRQFDYAMLTAATRAILGGARFVATNVDALLPVEGGQVLPGAGSIVAAIQAATGVEPTVVGKPEPELFRRGVERLGLADPAQVAMVGDRLDTDIVGARGAGLQTVLVLTGVTRPETAPRWQAQPDLVVASLAALAAVFGWEAPPFD